MFLAAAASLICQFYRKLFLYNSVILGGCALYPQNILLNYMLSPQCATVIRSVVSFLLSKFLLVYIIYTFDSTYRRRVKDGMSSGKLGSTTCCGVVVRSLPQLPLLLLFFFFAFLKNVSFLLLYYLPCHLLPFSLLFSFFYLFIHFFSSSHFSCPQPK